ncbi:MAG: bacterio-opsin activator [Clostridia bacterium]|nr:bacterio-opsin activator [Clostridia bacterium]
MTNNENNAKRIFDKQTKSWFEVTSEQYRDFDRWRTNLRKREQYHHRCMCPRSKWWLCDAMCQDCEFHAPGDNLYLDSPVISKKGEEVTLMDILEDPTPSIEDIICDKAELDKLFERLEELMPDAIRIGQLRQEGLSDAAIADVIGVKRTTFLSRIKKVKEQLSREYPELL